MSAARPDGPCLLRSEDNPPPSRKGLFAAGPRSHNGVEQTTEIPPLSFQVPLTFREILQGAASVAGAHAVSEYFSCPESSRLHRLGVRLKPNARPATTLDSRDLGSLLHVLLAIRPVHGSAAAFWALSQYGQTGLPIESHYRAYEILKTYDYEWPLENEPWDYLGVEVPVVTVVDAGGSVAARTVRYDAVVRPRGEDFVYSLEHKTAARDSDWDMLYYNLQIAVQCALWNANSDLVAKYGVMRGAVLDLLVKTVVPTCSRKPPSIPSPELQKRALEWLTMTERVRFQVQPDGSWPRFLQNCWGKFGPCPFVSLCHEGIRGDYQIPDGVQLYQTGEVP